MVLRVAILVLLLSSWCAATVCAIPPPACQRFWEADAVFVGTVLEINPSQRGFEPRGIVSTTTVGGMAYRVVFAVHEAFRGVRGDRVALLQSGSMADFPFQVGEAYFVYADGDAEKQEFGGVSYCDRTRPIHRAQEELAYVESLKGTPQGGRIYGTAGRQDEKTLYMGGPGPVKYPAQGARVEARDKEGQVFSTTVDRHGNFELVGLPPGEYTVSVTFSKQWEADPEGARIFHGSCAVLDFRPRPSASISGRLVATAGPIPGITTVSLVPVGTKNEDNIDDEVWDLAFEDEGTYELKGVPPGRYYVGINVSEPPNTNCPYPKTYYPGVQDRRKAKIIRVAPGRKHRNIDIRLPAPLQEREIEAQVLWSDGSPARGGYAFLRSPDHPYDIVGPNGVSRLDENGRIILIGFKGYEYLAFGGLVCVPGGSNTRESRPVPISPGTERITISITLEGSKCEPYARRSRPH